MKPLQHYADELLAVGMPPRDVPKALRWAQQHSHTTHLSLDECIASLKFHVRTTWEEAMKRETLWTGIRGTRGTLAEFEAHLSRRCGIPR